MIKAFGTHNDSIPDNINVKIDVNNIVRVRKDGKSIKEKEKYLRTTNM